MYNQFVHSLLWGLLWGFLKLAGTRSRSGPVQWIRYWSDPSSTPFGYSIGCEIVVRQLGLHPIDFGRWGIVFYAQIQRVMHRCDSDLMPSEYYRLLVHQCRIDSLVFWAVFGCFRAIFQRRLCQNFGKIRRLEASMLLEVDIGFSWITKEDRLFCLSI